MKKLLFASYLPFVMALGAVALLAFGMDYQTRHAMRSDQRAEVQAQVDILRARLESQIETGVVITRGIASLLSREGAPNQREFSTLVEGVTEGRPDVINVAWAPDLVITRVHPVAPNTAALGLDYRKTPSQLDAVLRVRDTGEFAFVGPVNLVQGGKGFIMRVPVYTVEGEEFRFKGILSTVFELNMFLDRVGVMADDLTIETALARVDGAGIAEEAFFGDARVASDAPILSDASFTGGTWRLFARPQGGWSLQGSELLYQRLLIALISAFVLGPLFLANRMAIARQKTIRDMEIADDRLKAFVKNSPGVFFTYLSGGEDRDQVDFITESCRDIWAADPVEIYQHPGILWKSFDADQQDAFKEEIERSRATLSPWNFSWRSTSRDGQVRALEGWGHPRPAEGNRMRWDCLVVDVTEQRRRDEEYERQAEIARQAQKQESIGQLTGGVAHDFNNMLAVIRGNMEMLQEDLEAENLPNDERIEFVKSAIAAAEGGNDLTRKMLSFARRASLQPENLDLNDIIRELEEWSGRTLPAHITLKNALADQLPQVRLDRSSAASAILNLMVNARDAMPDGGQLTIATKLRHLNAQEVAAMPEMIDPGDYVVLSISDTGLGIPQDSLDTVFEPFFTTKGPGAGSGLGLSMVQGFIAQSGGAIKVASVVGRGTTFQLFFKSVGAAKSTAAKRPMDRSMQPQSMLRILVAEDQEEVRRVLERTLKRLGHTVVAAENGEAALAIFKQDQDFDLLVTDIVMPGRLQGTALARNIRDIAPDFPVIVMSGYSNIALDKSSGLNPNDIRLNKPVSRADLIAAIEATMDRQSAPQRASG